MLQGTLLLLLLCRCFFASRRNPVRFSGKSRLGFYPLPITEAQRIRRFLSFPEVASTALDPCVGDGVAFDAITSGAAVLRYGIELDTYRAEQARERIPNTIQGNSLEAHCPVDCIGCLFCNPPYDWTLGSTESRRVEQSFLSHTYRWLKPGGILVLIIPGERLAECNQILASHFRDVRVYRLEAPECVRYKQVTVLGVRRNRRERERLTDAEIGRARLHYAGLARTAMQLPPLPVEPDGWYGVPPGGPVQLVYRGLPLDEIEDVLCRSSAMQSAMNLLIRKPESITGRPVTPLHGGHVGLLCTAGMLNGVFGEGRERHIAHWRSVKHVDVYHEEEDGYQIVRRRERFSHELTLAYQTGRVVVLKEAEQEGKSNEECT